MDNVLYYWMEKKDEKVTVLYVAASYTDLGYKIEIPTKKSKDFLTFVANVVDLTYWNLKKDDLAKSFVGDREWD